jgi:hypothetical protein
MEILPQTQQKFDNLLQLNRIERQHLDILSETEKELFLQTLSSKIPTLSGTQLDHFIEQTKLILNHDEIWELNHLKISILVERYIIQNGCIPTIADIAHATKLTRKTVTKHLNLFLNSTIVKEQKQTMQVMLARVIGKVLQQALCGDIKAARLYYDMASTQKPETPATKQNNYIQINNTLINQQILQLLEPDQLTQIENIISQAALKLKP